MSTSLEIKICADIACLVALTFDPKQAMHRVYSMCVITTEGQTGGQKRHPQRPRAAVHKIFPKQQSTISW